MLLSFGMSRMGMYIPSGILLCATAAALTIYYYRQSGRRVCPPAVFSMSWIGGIGIACMKLSNLETDWETETWVVLFVAYAAFIVGYKMLAGVRTGGKRHDGGFDATADIGMSLLGKKSNSLATQEAIEADVAISLEQSHFQSDCNQDAGNRVTLYIMLNALAFISVISFITEVIILGYVPLFTVDTPHAYSYFHVSGLHYFTVSCCLLPALGTLSIWDEIKNNRHLKLLRRIDISVCMALGVLIPILSVSRYQLFFGILLAACCILILNGTRISIKLSIKVVLSAAVALFAMLMLYIFITIARAHSIEYLNGIFEMKYELPIYISQPYIYVANNFDNLNCLVRELNEHTHGLRMLFPFIALSGLKFIRPELIAFPLYVTKEELTTVTLIYDSYYDFGLVGVIAFCLALGMAAAYIEQRAIGGQGTGHYFVVLLYAELMIYLSLSFFTTWLSNPTSWFLFGITLVGVVISGLLCKQVHDAA